MKKTRRLLCLGLLLAALLAGCASGENGSDPAQTQSAPMDSSPAPVIQIPTPIESGSAVDSVAAPAESASAPVESASAPVESTSAPVESSSAPAEHETAPVQTAPPPDGAEGLYLLAGGARIRPGQRYADVQSSLGEKTGPDQELGSCDDPSYVRKVHFYPGLSVTENPDGVIWGMELSPLYAGEGDAALLGAVRVGTTLDEALAALGRPENAASAKDDCMLLYRRDGVECCVFLDPDGGQTVSGVSLTLI